MTITILLTCVGGGLSSELIRQIKNSTRHKVRVIGTDMSESANGRHFCDAFYRVPSGNDRMYIDRIEDILSSNSVDLVVPTSDEEAIALSSCANKLKTYGATVACANHDVLKVITNKADTYTLLENAGIGVPGWRLSNSLDSLKTAVSELLELYGSLVVKPTVQRGGRGVYIVTKETMKIQTSESNSNPLLSFSEFLSLPEIDRLSRTELMVMERLEDPVFDLDMLTWHGECIKSVTRRRIDSARPNSGHIIAESQELADLASKLAKTLNLTWLYDCDLMFNKVGQPFILEINPRQSGSVATSIAAGVPLFDDLISLYLGKEVSKSKVPSGRMVVPFTSLHTFDR